MSDAVERSRWSRVALLDREFHETMVGAAGSKRLSRMFATLLAEAAMCIGALEPAYPRRREIVKEHRELLGALRLADEGSVHECVETHLDSAVSHLAERRARARPAGGDPAPGNRPGSAAGDEGGAGHSAGGSR